MFEFGNGEPWMRNVGFRVCGVEFAMVEEMP